MKLDYSALEKAIAQFEESLNYLYSDHAKQDPKLHNIFRLAAVQAFEFTYAIATKMIIRQLGQIVVEPNELPKMNFIDLMRSAADAGIIREALPFNKYREKRNKTSHVYDSKVAEEIVAVFGDFLQDVRFLLGELRKRNP